MRGFDARQRILDNRWEFSEFRDNIVFPIGYCHAYVMIEPSKDNIVTKEIADFVNAATAPFKHKYHNNGHFTAEEARDCYREYLLDQRLTLNVAGNPDWWCKCEAPEGCWEHTTKMAVLDHRHWHLCAKHMSRGVVEILFPHGAVKQTYCL